MNIKLGTLTAPIFYGSVSSKLEYRLSSEQIGSTFNPLQDSFSDITTELEDVITSASPGDTIDLGNKGFRPSGIASSPSERLFATITKANLTFENGYFYAIPQTTWTLESNGVYSYDFSAASADYKDSLKITGGTWLHDPKASTQPKFHNFPSNSSADILPEFSLCNGSEPADKDRNSANVTLDVVNNGITGLSFDDSNGWITAWKPYLTDGSNKTLVWIGPTNLQYTSPISSAVFSGTEGVDEICTITLDVQTNPDGLFTRFFFSGIALSSMVAGEYYIDHASSKVYYKPSYDGSPPDTAGISGIGAVVQASESTTFRNCTFVGGLGWGGTPATILTSGNSATLTVDKCDFRDLSTAIRCSAGTLELTKSRFRNMRSRGLEASGNVDQCAFFNSVESSCILMQGLAGTGETRRITRSLFWMPRSIHGQCISLYNDAYKNATVEGNIFYNCRQSLTWHDKTTGVDDGHVDEGLIIFNNLWYVDNTYLTGNEVESDFSGFMINSQSLDNVGDVFNIPAYVAMNTVFMNTSVIPYNTARCRYGTMQFSDSNAYWDLTAEGNIFSSINMNGSQSSATRNEYHNAYLMPAMNIGGNAVQIGTEQYALFYGEGTSTSDHGNYESALANHFSTTTLKPPFSSPLNTAAADGGAIGHRFTGGLTAADLASLDWDWSNTYEPIEYSSWTKATNLQNTKAAADYYDAANSPIKLI